MQKNVLSLVGFSSFCEIETYGKTYPDMAFELSYKMSKKFLQEVTPLISGKVASVHACCPQEPIFPNFGSHDEKVLEASFSAVERSFRTARQFKAETVVLHPGYVTDVAIPSDNKRRQALLDDPSFSPYVFKEEGSICYPSYPQSEVYRSHADQARKNLKLVVSLGKEYGIRLAVENLNPRVGYLFQTPEEMISLIHVDPELFICLDVGHLWISSCLYGFDYFSALEAILATGRVINCHLHGNSSNKEHNIYSDDHHSLSKYGFPYERVVRTLVGTQANLVLETVEDPYENTELLLALTERRRPTAL